jgi:hypothetical protein
MEISHQEALILSTIRGHLKGSVHREIDPADSDVIRKVFVKERGARIFVDSPTLHPESAI